MGCPGSSAARRVAGGFLCPPRLTCDCTRLRCEARLGGRGRGQEDEADEGECSNLVLGAAGGENHPACSAADCSRGADAKSRRELLTHDGRWSQRLEDRDDRWIPG